MGSPLTSDTMLPPAPSAKSTTSAWSMTKTFSKRRSGEIVLSLITFLRFRLFADIMNDLFNKTAVYSGLDKSSTTQTEL